MMKRYDVILSTPPLGDCAVKAVYDDLDSLIIEERTPNGVYTYIEASTVAVDELTAAALVTDTLHARGIAPVHLIAAFPSETRPRLRSIITDAPRFAVSLILFGYALLYAALAVLYTCGLLNLFSAIAFMVALTVFVMRGTSWRRR